MLPPLFGVATDDSHYYHGGNVSPGRGWVMVWAKELDANQLVKSMERGEFLCFDRRRARGGEIRPRVPKTSYRNHSYGRGGF